MLISPKEVSIAIVCLIIVGLGSIYYLAQRNGLVGTAYAQQVSTNQN